MLPAIICQRTWVDMASYEPKWHIRTGTGIHNPARQVSVISECRRVVASYRDSITSRDIRRGDRHSNQEGYMPVNQCVRSSSKLPRLGGSTKRHFPVWSTTQGTQLGVESHTYQCIANIHTICTICVDTTWHHNITLQHIIYLIDSEEST